METGTVQNHFTAEANTYSNGTYSNPSSMPKPQVQSTPQYPPNPITTNNFCPTGPTVHQEGADRSHTAYSGQITRNAQLSYEGSLPHQLPHRYEQAPIANGSMLVNGIHHPSQWHPRAGHKINNLYGPNNIEVLQTAQLNGPNKVDFSLRIQDNINDSHFIQPPIANELNSVNYNCNPLLVKLPEVNSGVQSSPNQRMPDSYQCPSVESSNLCRPSAPPITLPAKTGVCLFNSHDVNLSDSNKSASHPTSFHQFSSAKGSSIRISRDRIIEAEEFLSGCEF
jgi:hypothetical protein